MTDLIPRQRSSDSDAFESLYRDVVALVRRYAARHVGDQLADDVVAEALTAVWQKWDSLPSSAEERRAWTFGAARLAIKVVSRRHRGGLPTGLSIVRADEPSVADHADGVAADDRVMRLLSALPPAEFDAMWLVVWADLSPTDAARALGCSVTALTSRLARGRRHLRERLDEQAREGEVTGRVR